MRESVIYQDILEEGRKEEALKMVMRLLTGLFGTLSPELQVRIQILSVAQLEDLNEALFDFSEVSDLVNWLEEQRRI